MGLMAQEGVFYKPSLNGAAQLSNLKYVFSSGGLRPLEAAFKVWQSSCDTSNASRRILGVLMSLAPRLVTQRKVAA